VNAGSMKRKATHQRPSDKQCWQECDDHDIQGGMNAAEKNARKKTGMQAETCLEKPRASDCSQFVGEVVNDV
jgi:hypothetical protein